MMSSESGRFTLAAAVCAALAALSAACAGDNSVDFMLSGGDRMIPLVDDTVLVFTNSGTLAVTGSGTVELLAVGGGGGGGMRHSSNANYGGAGGGGGGVAHFQTLPVTAGTYDITVGVTADGQR